MLRLLIIGRKSQALVGMSSELSRNGFACSIASHDEVVGLVPRQSPDLLLVEMNGHLPGATMPEFIRCMKRENSLPVIALIAEGKADRINGYIDADDFLFSPYNDKELVLRIKRLIRGDRGADDDELIKCDGLVIDLAKCEATVDGRVIGLTFKEYELLRFLASNRGRVYTRDALLNKIWGYDYYGGDRTVDVHVRRLRSKIEDSKHTFIETVRNIGYRFRKDSAADVHSVTGI
jgi:two-component system alkaline phosphatase synthesis response regulator PhoP